MSFYVNGQEVHLAGGEVGTATLMPDEVGVPAVDRGSLEIAGSATAELRLTERDQVDPAGRYRLIVTADVVRLQRAGAASWPGFGRHDWSGTPTNIAAWSSVGPFIPDDVPFRLGDTGDQVFLNRSTALTPLAALANVLVGAPVGADLATNSLVVSNVTLNGDQEFFVNNGGNSIGWLFVDASAGLTAFNDGGADWDWRIEGDTNANMIVVDAGTDSLGFGAAVVAGAFFSHDGSAVNRAGVSGVGRGLHMPAATFTQTNADPTTLAISARVAIGIPTFAGTNLNQTLTDAATVYVAGAPAAGTNTIVSNAWSLWVDAGNVRFDGDLIMQAGATLLRGRDTVNVVTGITNMLGLAFTTNDYYGIGKLWTAYGGLDVYGLTENDASATIGVQITSAGGQAGATKSTAGIGLVNIYVTQHDGANGKANIAADGNILSVRARIGGADVTRWILDEDGDVWQTGYLNMADSTIFAAASLTVPNGYTVTLASTAGIAASLLFDAPVGAGGAADAVVKHEFRLDGGTTVVAGLSSETDGAGSVDTATTIWRIPYRDSGANVAAPGAPAAANNAAWNGGLRVEGGDDVNRLYFFVNEAWHYVNQTAGLSILAEERVDPWTRRRWNVGDLGIVRMAKEYGDGGADFLPYPFETALADSRGWLDHERRIVGLEAEVANLRERIAVLEAA